jgi:ApaG protein
MALARALYRAALRGAQTINEAEGGVMQLVGPVLSAEWGSYRRLTAQDRDTQRETFFPWASQDDTASEPGALTGAELKTLARRRFREPSADVETALDDGLAALRGLNDLLEVHAGSASRETAGVRVSATASYVGVANSGARVFAYRLRIVNTRPDTVRLESRSWAITALPDGAEEEVVPRGSPGVVGQTPTLGQGAEFEYASGTELHAAAGTVRGSFEFVSLEGDERFEAEVPPFALAAPTSESSV